MMKSSEILLASGLATVALAASLVPFPHTSLLGRGLLPVAFVLLVAAFALLPKKPGVPIWWRRIIFILYLIAVLLAIYVAGDAALRVFDSLKSSLEDVDPWEWTFLALSSLTPATLFFLALHLRSTWSEKRCALWTVGLLLVCPVGVAIFRLLAFFLPLNA